MSQIVALTYSRLQLNKFTRIIVVLIMLVLTRFYAVSQNNSISSSVALTKFDFFHSFEYEYQPTKFAFNASFGYGINRTIFQQRFYPRIAFGSTYYSLDKDRFQIGTSFNYALSMIRLTINSKQNFWNEFNLGFSWSYGEKWKVGQTLLVGYVNESHFSTIEKKRVNASTIGYFVSIKLVYEI